MFSNKGGTKKVFTNEATGKDDLPCCMEAAGARLDTMKPMLEDNKAFVSESNVAGEDELGG